jgi:hypothetical protein
VERIPPLAWAAIGIIVLLTVVINIILVAMLVAKNPRSMNQRPPRGFATTAQKLAQSGEVLRDPFAKERGQLNELSRLVHNLDQPAAPPTEKEENEQDDRAG